MAAKVLKSNALVLSYQALSDEGENVNKSQRFNIIPEDITVDELFGMGTSISTILANSVKEMRQDLSFIILEA